MLIFIGVFFIAMNLIEITNGRRSINHDSDDISDVRRPKGPILSKLHGVNPYQIVHDPINHCRPGRNIKGCLNFLKELTMT